VIYFARGLVSGLWKVGYTGNVAVRARSLATLVREPIEVVAVVRGGVLDERALHRSLAASRATEASRGTEWYRDDGAVAAMVAALPVGARGSFVARYAARPPRRRRPAAVRAAEQQSLRDAFVAEHGHEFPVLLGCAKCDAQRARFRRLVEANSPLLRRPRREVPAFLTGRTP